MGFFDFLHKKRGARASRPALAGRVRLGVEGLEERVVPYALSGNAWPSSQLVTISFVPDGSIVGTNGNGYIYSNLFSTFNQRFGSAVAWQNVILKAAQQWAAQTNLNFAVVADDGSMIGGGNYQQGAPNFGDIRIGGYNFCSSTLAQAFMPPSVNNFSIAGDIQFNTGKGFNVGSTYDLQTVAEHEIGHALGLYHSSYGTAAMYGIYNGVKSTLTPDDVSGIRAIYSNGQPRSPDRFDANGGDHSFATAAPLTSLLDPQLGTAAVSGLDITTTADADYYSVTAPLQTSGTFTVSAPSTGLSLLAPSLTVYAADQTTVLGTATGSGSFGSTDIVTVNNVSAGQQFFLEVTGADSSAFGTGAYGLGLDFGDPNNLPVVPPPNTQLANGNPLSSGGGQALNSLSLETQVNTFTSGTQQTEGPQQVGMDANGNYVVVWSSQGQDGSGWGVFGQRYSVSGTPLGGEFRVNTFTAGDQNAPAVAMAPDGSFVVAWQSQGQDGSGLGVFAQRYDASGNPLGGEFRANTTTAGDQGRPSVAVDAHGDFVIAWQSQNQYQNQYQNGGWLGQNQGGSGSDVFAQRFNSSGTPQGGEFRVNSTTANDQKEPEVAMDAAGDFVVVWQSAWQDGFGWGIYGQRYDSAGNAQGGEFRVNTTTLWDQVDPAVAMAPAGNFVVTWSSWGQGVPNWGIHGQSFFANGAPTGAEFQVNVATAGDKVSSSVAFGQNGSFLVVWQSQGQDGSGWGVYGRQYNGVGIPVSGDVLLSTTTSGDQVHPSSAADPNGDVVAVWSGNGQGDGNGVFAQRFQNSLISGLNDLVADAYSDTGHVNRTLSGRELPCMCPLCRGATGGVQVGAPQPDSSQTVAGFAQGVGPGEQYLGPVPLSEGTEGAPAGPRALAFLGALDLWETPPGARTDQAHGGGETRAESPEPKQRASGLWALASPLSVAVSGPAVEAAAPASRPALESDLWTRLSADSFREVRWLEQELSADLAAWPERGEEAGAGLTPVLVAGLAVAVAGSWKRDELREDRWPKFRPRD